jgi:predicted adenylyl cyclase CyaB
MSQENDLKESKEIKETKEAPKILEFTEFETKYKIADGNVQYEFKRIMEQVHSLNCFYVQSDDVYFVKGDEFLRYRFADDKKVKRSELTYKAKIKSANNIIRKEINLRVDANDRNTVKEFCETLGYIYNFTINKACHIYHADDATLVFYSVRDSDNELTHFIEIEVGEDLKVTESQGWDIIKKWEKALEPLGIKAQNRLRKSLFEMYRKIEPVEQLKLPEDKT